MTQTPAISDILGSIRRPERTVRLCLAGDLQAEFERLEAELVEARQKPESAPTLGGSQMDPRVTELARQIEELRELMLEHTVVFRFAGLPSKAYSDMVAKHPPKDGSKRGDVDMDGYSLDLVASCAVEPKMTVDEARQLSEALTQAQWDSLVSAAYACNKEEFDVPFSWTASAVLGSSKKNSH
jgi:hypothetical protein